MSNSVSFIAVFIVVFTCQRMRCSARAATNDCKRNLDIVFLLDESESVGPVGFKAIKGYTKQILQGLDLSMCDNVGLITFSHFANSQIFRGPRNMTADVIARIDALEGPSRYVPSELEESEMNLGLLLAESFFSGRRMKRRSPEKFLVVITDGHRSQQDERSMENFAKKLTKKGVVIHVLAVGNDTSIPMLLEIAPDERNIFDENDVDDLIKMLLSPKESDECERKIDIGFVLDSSESIGPVVFKAIKEYTKEILQKLNVSKCDNVGLIKFDEFATSETYFGAHDTEDVIFTKLDGLEGPVRFVASEVNQSNINLGLLVADEILFTKQLGSRQFSDKFLVVMTDGRHTKQMSTNQTRVFDNNFVKKLTRKGVRILVLAMGDEVSIQELLKFTSQERDIFPEEQVDGLIASLLSKRPPLLRKTMGKSHNIIV